MGYWGDYDSKDEYITYPELTKEVDMVKNFISQAKAGGGRDCGDMWRGLNYALKYKWKSSSRLHWFQFVCICVGLLFKKDLVIGITYNPVLNKMYTALKEKEILWIVENYL